MFHLKLLELEAELIAKEEAARGLPSMTFESNLLLDTLEQEVGLKLGDKAPRQWRGWLTYRHDKTSLVICRGRSFSSGFVIEKWRAGLDLPNGADAIADYERGFDVTPPQDLDHLLVNFGSGETTRVFLWYGENIAAYRLIFEASLDDNPEEVLHEAVLEACGWILKRPKHTTLVEFLKQHECK